jgi:tetratricopeptide (TPR) repeat protein
LTLAVIARNEEAVLGRCLDSVREVASEMLVVDTGSTDRTRAVAEERGARVLEFPWCDDFAAARNVALEAASGCWILVLDADEYLAPDAGKKLGELVSAKADRAYRILNRSVAEGGRGGLVGRMVRLFPNLADVRYEWPVHEQVEESLKRAGIPIVDSALEVLHTGYASPEVNAKKQARNLRIMEAELAKGAVLPPMLQFLRGGALLDLKETERALEAYVECLDRCVPGGALEDAVRVRLATCLSEMERWQELLELEPKGAAVKWHPELLLCLGKAALKTGNVGKGLEWLHTVLAVPPAIRIPACDDVRVMIQAVEAVAEFVQTRDSAKAVALMRLAVQATESGDAPSLEAVLRIHRGA